MNLNDKLNITQKNIRKAIEDYWAHTSCGTQIKNDISENFIHNLAYDSVRAKESLRNMLRKSPAWNEELDALVINGNVTHDPDYNKVWGLALKIFQYKLGDFYTVRQDHMYACHRETGEILRKERNKYVRESYETPNETLFDAIRYFVLPDDPEQDTLYLDALKKLAPNAYAPGKKISRIFKGLCDALGVSDDTANSEFQRLFAMIADEMNARQLSYKLYVSINPAHFLTMSNPKCDQRGSCMTSCHSLNTTSYEYNNGCTGYARDEVTMIAFTVKDDSDPASLNNRKTTRQLFMYKPGNGLLLQSRMYNTSGGTSGAQAESRVYRNLIQQEISRCENAVNSWHTFQYADNRHDVYISSGSDFGGYPDWDYEEYVPMCSIRKDHGKDYKSFRVGVAGLCVICGEETSNGMYCKDCDEMYNDKDDYENDYEDDE